MFDNEENEWFERARRAYLRGAAVLIFSTDSVLLFGMDFLENNCGVLATGELFSLTQISAEHWHASPWPEIFKQLEKQDVELDWEWLPNELLDAEDEE